MKRILQFSGLVLLGLVGVSILLGALAVIWFSESQGSSFESGFASLILVVIALIGASLISIAGESIGYIKNLPDQDDDYRGMDREEMMFEAIKYATYDLVGYAGAIPNALQSGMKSEEIRKAILRTHFGEPTATAEFRQAYKELEGRGE